MDQNEGPAIAAIRLAEWLRNLLDQILTTRGGAPLHRRARGVPVPRVVAARQPWAESSDPVGIDEHQIAAHRQDQLAGPRIGDLRLHRAINTVLHSKPCRNQSRDRDQ